MADRTDALAAAFSDAEVALVRQAEEVADLAISPR